MITINGAQIALLRSTRLPNQGRVVGMPEDTRSRLNVQVGGSVTIQGQRYEVQRAFMDEVHAADQNGFPQDAVVFMRSIPRGLSVDQSVPRPRPGTTGTSRRQTETTQVTSPPRTRAPRAAQPAPAVQEREPEVAEPTAPAVEVQPLPRLEINGFNLVPCLGHSMGRDETEIVRMPSAVRGTLMVNRGDVISIGGRRFTVRSAARADLDRYPNLPQSEVIFFHQSVGNFPLFTGEETTTEMAAQPPAPIVVLDPDVVRQTVQDHLRTLLGESIDDPDGIMNDLHTTVEIQDGNARITVEYLPGVRGTSGAPDNVDAALTDAAEGLCVQLRALTTRNQRLLAALSNA